MRKPEGQQDEVAADLRESKQKKIDIKIESLLQPIPTTAKSPTTSKSPSNPKPPPTTKQSSTPPSMPIPLLAQLQSYKLLPSSTTTKNPQPPIPTGPKALTAPKAVSITTSPRPPIPTIQKPKQEPWNKQKPRQKREKEQAERRWFALSAAYLDYVVDERWLP